MKKYYKKRYALTDQGATNLSKATVACFFAYCINIAPMILLMLIIDQLLFLNITQTWTYVLGGVLTLIAMWCFLSYEYTNLYNATYKEAAELRMDISKNLSELPLAYFSKHDLSDLSQVIMSDVQQIEHALSHSIPKVYAMLFFFPILGLMMILGNWKLGLAIICPTLLSFIVLPFCQKITVSRNQKYFDVLRDNSELFQETIEMQQEISSFNQNERFKEMLDQKMDESERIHFRVEASTFMVYLISVFFSYLNVAACVIVGIHLLIQQEINLLYFIGYLIGAFKFKELFDVSKEGLLEVQFIEPAVKRIKEIRTTALQSGQDMQLSHYDIEFKDVSFAYQADQPVLKNVSFTAKQGEVTALVGVSGCGKTSILRLISRLYDYDNGQILIDGHDIQSISTAALFEYISIVFQDVVLFNTSILENIRLGKKDASDEDVKRAAHLANCMDFIERLPEGFDTQIGENGAELSGGERQRLAIARAFLKDAPILILDELAASLDIDHEQKIQDSLNQLIQDKTVIIISHRLKSIENVDQIVVIDEGQVESIGAHQDLLKTSFVYQNLIKKTQMAEMFKY